MDLNFLTRPYAIIGGVATRAYMPERTTIDLDILVHSDDRLFVHEALQAARFTYLQELSIPGSAWRSPQNELLDILERGDSWVRGALNSPNRQLDGSPVISLPYLILLKLEAGRGRDIGDLTQLLALANDADLEQIRQTIAQHLPDAVEDLESLRAIGQLEHE